MYVVIRGKKKIFMALEKLEFDIYDEYLAIVHRYMELNSFEKKGKVDAASINIMYAIQDINYQIEQYQKNESNLAVFYQTMLKTDFLVGAIEILYKVFFNESDRKKIWGSELNPIKQFRLYRSLTLAHPLDTTRYSELGYGTENKKWCEDVRPKNSISAILKREFEKADYIIFIRVEGKESVEKIPISLEHDILSIDRIALIHLKLFTEKLKNQLNRQEEELKKTPLKISSKGKISEYISQLLIEVEKRYPSEIEKIVYEDGSSEEYSLLREASERLQYVFDDSMKEEKYKRYKNEIQEAVYSYADSVQNMSLEDGRAHKKLRDILCPDFSVLVDESSEENADYKYGKIVEYLSTSSLRSIESAKEKLDKLSYDGCSCEGACTDAEWGVIQLLILEKELTPFFSIDFNSTDRELYFQFCTAVYYADKARVK